MNQWYTVRNGTVAYKHIWVDEDRVATQRVFSATDCIDTFGAAKIDLNSDGWDDSDDDHDGDDDDHDDDGHDDDDDDECGGVVSPVPLVPGCPADDVSRRRAVREPGGGIIDWQRNEEVLWMMRRRQRAGASIRRADQELPLMLVGRACLGKE